MLKSIKLLIGINDTDKDDLLNEIMGTTEERLKNKLGGLENIPSSLTFIVKEVSIIRFNRLTSEGMTSESVDGHSVNYSESDFSQYQDDIDTYLENDGASNKGKVRFF